MGNNDFKIGYISVWALIVGHLLLISFGAFAKIVHWDYYQLFLISGLFCLTFSWLIVFIEIRRNKIYNKTFWLMSMFILPTISPVVYMIRRNKLIRNKEYVDFN